MDRKVTILVPSVPHYRWRFYRDLRAYLVQRSIDLRLIYGREISVQSGTDNDTSLPWAKAIDHVSFTVGGVELCWQPYGRYIGDSDLVIVQQANRLLLNYLLIAKRTLGGQKIAFWGHGRDLQRNPGELRNRWKRVFTNRVDWWFAYTEEVKAELVRGCFPSGRITTVQNSIDTEELLRVKDSISARELELLRGDIGIGVGPIGLYCGRIYKEKRIDFLLEACRRVRETVSTFELVVVGEGPEQGKVSAACHKLGWIHYVGPKFGKEKIAHFLLSDICLMPGLVGLVVLDCFALEVPLITTCFPFHSPEITYLKNRENGLMTNDNIESYVADVCNVLSDAELLGKLKAGCRTASCVYGMGSMVENFGKGIIACLEAERAA